MSKAAYKRYCAEEIDRRPAEKARHAPKLAEALAKYSSEQAAIAREA